ncbi:MAG TPA: amidohydrolase family protein [Ilumatobacter sp.]|nr:amidohydrolase family protein [Ilumatobacter sp.]
MPITHLLHATVDGEPTDVLIADGTIVAVAAAGSLAPSPGTDLVELVEVDLSGHVLLPAAVEPHAHLDKAFLAEVVPNPAGDLHGAIEAMQAHRHLLTYDDTVARAERAARLMARNGYVAVRTHADTVFADGHGNGLTSIAALAEVRERVRGVIDIEIVALSGIGVVGPAGAGQRALLADALAAGADLVGGCPHLEGDIEAATDVFLQIASDHGCGVDLHTDETLDPHANGLDVLARRVLAGFDLPATASHCVSLGQQPDDVQRATAERVAAARVGVVALPHTNLFLQGRGLVPMPRGLTAVAALRAAGVTLAAGADNVQDPFNPVGRACPFETAGLMVMAAHLLPGDAWRSVSTEAAAVLGRPGAAGIRAGAPADLLAVPASTEREAIAFAPPERRRWMAGPVVSTGSTTLVHFHQGG